MYMYAVLSKKTVMPYFSKKWAQKVFLSFLKNKPRTCKEIFHEKKIFGYKDISKTDKNAILKLFFHSTVQKSQSDKFCRLLN